MSSLILSLIMLAGIALIIGAIARYRRGEAKPALLMLVAAVVAFANVAIILVPID